VRIDESARTSLTGLSVLLCNAMFIFTPMNAVGSILGRRHRLRIRPRSPFWHILCYGTPFLKVDHKPFALQCLLIKCPTPCYLRAPIRPGVCYLTSKQLPRRLSHRQPSNVASPTKNPTVIIVIKIYDIEALKKSGWTNVMIESIMKTDTALCHGHNAYGSFGVGWINHLVSTEPRGIRNQQLVSYYR